MERNDRPVKMPENERELLAEVAQTTRELYRNQLQMAVIRSHLPGLAWQMGRERATQTVTELADLAPKFLDMQDSMLALLDGKARGPALSDTGREAVLGFVRLLEDARREIQSLILGMKDALAQETH